MEDYIYKGLAGSRLLGYAEPYSDVDYICIAKEPKNILYQANFQDTFCVKTMDFIKYVFETDPKDVDLFSRANEVPGWVFSTPTEDNDFSKFLIANREKIVESNKRYWYSLTTTAAKDLIEDRAAITENSFLFLLNPKQLSRYWVRLRPAINYPKGMSFQESMLLSDDDKNFIRAIRKSKLSNLEILDKIKKDYEESLKYEDFWNVPQDFVMHNQLKMETYSYFQ